MTAPPPALHNAHTIEYAVVDQTVTFEQRHTLNVGGEWLGEVTNLAICRNLDEATFMVFHCDNEWNVLGVAAGYNSAEDAKVKTESSYHGLAAKWLPTGYSLEDAKAYGAELFNDRECSFCGRRPPDCHSMAGDLVRICNYCVDEFYQAMHENFKGN